MSYAEYELSVQDGRPRYRVLFVIAGTEYRFSNDTIFVSDSNGTWEPSAIELSGFSQTNEMAKDPLQITFPRDNLFALLFQGGVPEQVISVTVYRGHWHDEAEEYLFYWKGRIAGVSSDGDLIKLNCENIFTSLRRPGLRAKYQKTCRHPLYNRGCTLDKANFAIAATAVSVNGFTVTVPTGELDGHFDGGMIQSSDGSYRYITKQEGAIITMLRPLPFLEEVINSSVGEAGVTLYPGCNHTTTDCANRFDNLLNFGGYPWLPGKNPFGNNVTGSIA